MTDASEAIARAKAIAARLAGTGAVPAVNPASAVPVPAPPGGYAAYGAAAPTAGGAAPTAAGGAVDAATVRAAEEALAMAFGTGGGGGGAPAAAPIKRKRWGDDGGAGGGDDADKRARLIADSALAALQQQQLPPAAPAASGVDAALLAAMGGGGAATSSARTTRKIPIPVDQNPGYNYVGLLIGPGGSKQRELVAAAGGKVKISIRGRGSNKNDPGQEDEPLHVLLEGEGQCVDRAFGMIHELLSDTDKADAEKARQLGGLKGPTAGGGGGGGGGAGGGDGHYGPAGTDVAASAAGGGVTASGSTYTPQPVASLIGGPGGSTFGPPPGATSVVEEKIGVPNGVVGFIIGRGGESITSMQRRSDCKVQIQKEHEMEPGSAQRVITLTASTAESVSMCRGIIEAMVSERLQMNAGRGGGGMGGPGLGMQRQSSGPGGGGGGSQETKLQQAIAEGQHLVTVQVPNADVGLIIGRGGSTIKSMQDRSGANIQIPQVADADNPAVRTISVTHPTAEGANFAKQLIEEVIKEKMDRQGGAGPSGGAGGAGPGPGGASVQLQIPDKDVGMCIGKGGCVIKAMQERSGTRIQIPSQPTPGQFFRMGTVTGSPEQCNQVKAWIEQIVNEQSAQCVLGGTSFTPGFSQQGRQPQEMYGQQQQGAYGGGQGAYGQQQQGAYGQQQQGGAGQKTDYSAEWAAYYAAQAAQQGGAGAPAPAPGAPAPAPAAPSAASGSAPAPAPAANGSAQPAADAYYDAFFRYASYYGEEAARKYYGAWSPPEGTPNPYGSAAGAAASPAGAPAAGAGAASPAAPAPAAPQQEVKDSSARRGVSNLPAWMTKQQGS